MAPALTVRNLTPGKISLRRVESFEDPNSKQSKSTAFPFASKQTSPLTPSAAEIGEHAQTFNHEETDITLAPFESYTLPSKAVDTQENKLVLSTTTLRLTIETANGERYRIDTNPTYTQKASQSFTPLTPNPSFNFTALYHPSNPTPHLTIHTNTTHDLSNWMSTIPSNFPLSALSIPGTHNSHTYYRALPSVRCQSATIQDQLTHGIRFLDIRVQPVDATSTSKKDLYLVHGAFPISLTGPKYLAPILDTIYAFLTAHPTETILLSLKREGIGSSTDTHLSHLLQTHYIAPNPSKWYTSSTPPTLGTARGRIILVRRYTLHPSLTPESAGGLDATAWPNNSTHALHGPFCVQDWCEVMLPSDINQKLGYCNEQLVRSAGATAWIPGVNTDVNNPVPEGAVFLNFLSGSNFWKVGCWPDRIARVVNRGVEEWVCRGVGLEKTAEGDGEGTDVEGRVRRRGEGDGGTGVLVMDFVGEGGDWDLVGLVVGLNMGVLGKV